MKKLLSLPPNLVGCFHEITKHSPDEWFCCCDPSGKILTPIPVFRWERGQKRLPGTLEAVFLLISAISAEMALCVSGHSTAGRGRINLLKT